MSSSTNDSNDQQIDESGYFEMTEEYLGVDISLITIVFREPVPENVPILSPIVDYEDSSLESSQDAVQVSPNPNSLRPPIIFTSASPSTPSLQPESSTAFNSPVQSTSQESHSQTCKRKHSQELDEYFAVHEENARRRECMNFVEIERERIGQREEEPLRGVEVSVITPLVPSETVSENEPIRRPIVDYEDSSLESSQDAVQVSPDPNSLKPTIQHTSTSPSMPLSPKTPQSTPPSLSRSTSPSPPPESTSLNSPVQSSSQVSLSQTCMQNHCQYFVELERERERRRNVERRHRDQELRLKSRWLEFLKEALK